MNKKKINTTDSGDAIAKTESANAHLAFLRGLKNGDWGEALPLLRTTEESMDYPLFALPEPFGTAANRIHQVVRARPAICGQSIMASLFLAVQSEAIVKLDGRSHPVSEFFLTLAMTGDRKSAADNLALAPHRQFEQAQWNEYTEQCLEYKDAKEVYEKERYQVLSNRKLSTTQKNEALKSIRPPVAPLSPAKLIDDPTFEGIVRHLRESTPSCGIFTDEGGKILGGYALAKDNTSRTVSGLSNLWDGKELKIARGGEGSICMLDRRLSSHILAQPTIARDYLANEIVQGQGILGRSLIAVPDPRPAEDYIEVDPFNDPGMKNYLYRMQYLLERPLRMGSTGGIVFREIGFEPRAKADWIRFHNDAERWRVDGTYGSLSGFTAKAAEHVTRISAAFALGQDIECSTVSPEDVERAATIVKYHLNELQRLDGSTGSSPHLLECQALLSWLLRKSSRIVATKEIYQKGPKSVRDARKARRLMDTLHEHNLVRPSGVDSWEIRPEVCAG